MEEYAISLTESTPALLVNKFFSQHKAPLTKAERISEQVKFFYKTKVLKLK